MEKIDLNNYEAYFLDFMEGTLSAEDKHDLAAFLNLHPALKLEMEEDFGAIELVPDTISYDAKEALKIDESKLILTANTIGDFMIASVEGQLTGEQNKQLTAYVKEQNLEKTFAYYKATILKADASIVYQEKEKLKGKTGVIISMPFIARITAVAAVGLILVTVAVNWGGSSIAENDSVNSTVNYASEIKGTNFINRLKSKNSLFDVNDTDTKDEFPTFEKPNKENNQIFEDLQENNIAVIENIDPIKNIENIDSSKQKIEKNILPNNFEELNKEGIVLENNPPKNKEVPTKQINEEDLVETGLIYASVKTEEPYKIVTDMASNMVDRPISFTRDKDVKTKEYVAYSFKLGDFEFERKKAR